MKRLHKTGNWRVYIRLLSIHAFVCFNGILQVREDLTHSDTFIIGITLTECHVGRKVSISLISMFENRIEINRHL